MPFAVFSQSCVRVDWKKIDALPDHMTKFQAYLTALNATKNSAILEISNHFSISLEDLNLRQNEYYLNDKRQVSSSFSDRDNACLVLDLKLMPNRASHFKCCGYGPFAIMLPVYTVEKIP